MSDPTTQGKKSRSKFLPRLWILGFTISASFAFTSLVALTYHATKDYIRANEKVFLQRAILRAADLEVPKRAKQVAEKFEQRVKVARNDNGEVAYYQILDQDGQRQACVVPCKGKGLWGSISAVVGFAMDCETLTGIDFTKQNETPGLGGRITEKWFKEQFKGKQGPFELLPEDSGSEDKGAFDGITGATITSKAVKKMLNQVCRSVEDVVNHGGDA